MTVAELIAELETFRSHGMGECPVVRSGVNHLVAVGRVGGIRVVPAVNSYGVPCFGRDDHHPDRKQAVVIS